MSIEREFLKKSPFAFDIEKEKKKERKSEQERDRQTYIEAFTETCKEADRKRMPEESLPCKSLLGLLHGHKS